MSTEKKRSQHSVRREGRELGRNIKRTFLGWDRPILHSAVEFLWKSFTQGPLWDMERTFVVLPSSIAARRLRQLMAIMANEKELTLRPPKVVTIGDFQEELYKARYPFASPLQQAFAWVDVLRGTPATELSPLLVQTPASDQIQPWMELAGVLSALHRELSSDLTMFSDVMELLDDDREVERWRVLSRLQNRYLDRLTEQKLWDIQTARRFAVSKQEARLPEGHQVILIGVVDLNRVQRYLLDLLGDSVTTLVGAPESWSENFDGFGALRSEQWQDLCVDLPGGVLLPHATTSEVAETVSSLVGQFSAGYCAQEITIGVPDPEVLPPLVERLERSDVPVRLAAGVPVGQTAALRILRMAAEYVASGRFDDFAGLIRVPAIEHLIRRDATVPKNYLQQIDQYYQETLIGSVRLPEFPERPELVAFQRVLNAVDEWLRPMMMERCELQNWASVFRKVLEAVIADLQVDVEDEREANEYQAFEQVANVLTQLEDLPTDLSLNVGLNEAIGWLAREVEGVRLAPMTNPHAIELMGWLELALDDAPILLLTGIHDGTVPESLNSDPFLPNAIRKRLGLLDNDRRYARDCYLLHVMLHAREHLRILTNHYNADGSPQTPSRLLLAVQPDQLAGRILSILKPKPDLSLPTLKKNWLALAGQSNIPIPLPNPELGRELQGFTATDLTSYLYCPYRFYLNKVCRLRSVDDSIMELQANTFGDLIHNCVAALKGSPVQDSTSAEDIRKFLFNRLLADANQAFGKVVAPAVRVQIEQARLRLARFAELQAQRAQAGWRILETEVDVTREMKVNMEVDGETVYFYGRLDRIDYHPESDQYAIWDYKTSDNPKQPLKAHLERDGWVNLQLPLYRHLVKGLGIKKVASVGYINLPKAVDQIAFEVADFTEDQLQDADKKIHDVVSAARKGIFWPPRHEDVYSTDDFLQLTQYNVANRWNPSNKIVTDLVQGVAPKSDLLLQPSDASLTSSARALRLTDQALGVTQAALPHRVSAKIPKPTQRKTCKPERITPVLNDAVGTAPVKWYSSTLIRASAGSGKTYQLSKRVIRLLFADEAVDSFLATTFTRKAAGEILERVLTQIANAVVSDEGLERVREMVTPLVISKQSCKYQLARLCSDLHRLRISTLDSFYNELARSFSLELNLPPGWRLADPHQERTLQVQAINQMFYAIDRDQLSSLISQLCKGQAVRGVWREIASTVDAGYSIYLTTQRNAWMHKFPVAATQENQIQSALDRIGASTCSHKSYAASRDKLIEFFQAGSNAEFLGHTLVAAAMNEEMTFSRKPIVPDVSEDVLVLVRWALAHEFAILEQQNQSAYELLANYNLQVENIKRRDRLLTFSDISLRLANWIQKRLDALIQRQREDEDQFDLRPIHQRLDSRIKHLLLDEFQDTSPAQWKILQPFALDVYTSDSLQSQKTSLFCVGDTKQAIYGWRGGASELFEVIERQLQGITSEPLAESRRSSPIIIDFVNAVFHRLLDHDNYGDGVDAIVYWNERFPTHECHQKDLPGYVQIYNGAKVKGTTNQSNADGDEEAANLSSFQRCVQDIAGLHSNSPKKSIAVLVRTNEEVSAVINLLREQNIDASQEGGNPLTDSAAVDLLLSLIALADHPGDGISYFHVMHSAPESFLSILPASRTAEELSTWVRHQVMCDGYADTISRFATCIASTCNERDQLRLEQLIQLAYSYEQLQTPRLRDFVDYVQNQKVSLPKPAAVRVMTVHQSKGLEFDAVFLPNLSRAFVSRNSAFIVRVEDTTSEPDGVTRRVGSHLKKHLSQDWQQAFDKDAVKQLQESLCNFYVAITRSRQALYIYTSPSKKPVQQWGSVLHSIFAPEDREQEDTLLYSLGNANWCQDLEQSNSTPQSLFPLDGSDSAERSKPVIALHPYFHEVPNAKKVRVLSSLRPSSVGELHRKIPLQKALEPAATFGTIAGTLVHRWFEDIEWIDGYVFDPARAKEQALEVLTPAQMPLIDIDEWVSKFAGYLELEGVREVLSKEQYHIEQLRQLIGRDLRLTIRNECRLLEFIDGSLLQGSIDRLVLVEDGANAVAAEIIDYKTDFFDPFRASVKLEDWIESKQQRHGPQLRLYRDAIARIYRLPKERITMTLMLLSADVVTSIDG